jgi:hypothetical protein
MNHVENQKGERIIAVGAEGSHVRNRDVFNITIPKMIEKIWSNYYWGGTLRHTRLEELDDICQDDNGPKEWWRSVQATAYYYFDEERKQSLHKADVIPSVCDGCIHNECKNTWIEPCHSCSNGNNKQTEV